MNSYYILIILSSLLLFVLSAIEHAFSNYNRLKFEVDLKEGRRYTIITQELLDKRVAYQKISRFLSDILLLVIAISTFFIISNIFYAIFLSLILVLTISKFLPTLVTSLNPDLILKYFIFVAKLIFILFYPFLSKRYSMDRESDILDDDNDITIFKNALNFSDVKLRECMIPRTEICSISIDSSVKSLIDLFAESNYSRIIVYRDNLDQIVGYVHSKDIFKKADSIKSIVREIGYYPQEMDAHSLLKTMIRKRRSIAVVNDEYGGTAGIVTLEDLMEEIFGEISDELDKEELIEKRLSANEFIFSARLEIKYLNSQYDLDLPESEDYETLGGFITYINEDIPEQGDIVKYQSFEFNILKTSTNRLDSVSLRIINQ